MPQLIRHIDAIAREKNRDALFVEFHPGTREARRDYDYAHDLRRTSVIDWLDAHGVGWEPCGPYANPSRMESYLGQIYIDVPYDDTLDNYCQLRDRLENPDGSMRDERVRFNALALSYAMKNSEHDEPGFWERVAEQF